jgi:hypothetical protein
MSLAFETDGGRRAVVDTARRLVLARAHSADSTVAICLHPTPTPANADRTCGTPIQRTPSGDLLDGVRAHYRTVHPGRKIR